MSFSVPRWSKPICGSTRSTISPSSSSTSRSTPCAAGCCGPKLMVKLRWFSDIGGSILALRRRERGEQLGPGHGRGAVGELVVRRLLVDENLAGELKAVAVV